MPFQDRCSFLTGIYPEMTSWKLRLRQSWLFLTGQEQFSLLLSITGYTDILLCPYSFIYLYNEDIIVCTDKVFIIAFKQSLNDRRDRYLEWPSSCSEPWLPPHIVESRAAPTVYNLSPLSRFAQTCQQPPSSLHTFMHKLTMSILEIKMLNPTTVC